MTARVCLLLAVCALASCDGRVVLSGPTLTITDDDVSAYNSRCPARFALMLSEDDIADLAVGRVSRHLRADAQLLLDLDDRCRARQARPR